MGVYISWLDGLSDKQDAVGSIPTTPTERVLS